ncbi:trichome birefringence-like protein 26, partial [Tanacetum coccineum]
MLFVMMTAKPDRPKCSSDGDQDIPDPFPVNNTEFTKVIWTVPFKNGEIDMRDIDMLMRDIELEEYENAKEGMHGSALRLFDTTRLSLLRPDGHPGPYRVFHPFDGHDGNAKVQNDCLHWCLPGPIDSWND